MNLIWTQIDITKIVGKGGGLISHPVNYKYQTEIFKIFLKLETGGGGGRQV